jgi:hypothetical protein
MRAEWGQNEVRTFSNFKYLLGKEKPVVTDLEFGSYVYVTYKLTQEPKNEAVRSKATTNKKQKQTPWSLVRERTIPTVRPPLVGEI